MSSIGPPARRFAESCGLPRAWRTYLLVLLSQAILVLAALRWRFGAGISRTGIVLHAVLLTGLVIAVHLFTRPLAAFRFVDGFVVPAFLGLIQLLLLLVYVSAGVGLHYQEMPLNAELLGAYLARPGVLVEVAGLSTAGALAGAVLLFLASAACIAWPVVLFRRGAGEPGSRGRLWVSLAMLCALYAATRDAWRPRELFHVIHFDEGFISAPVGLLSRGVRLEPTYGTSPRGPVRPRPLVLITVDALRRDAMQVYGNPIANTPFLASLVAKGSMQRLENATSLCTTSYCALVGTLSSRYWFQLDRTPDNLPDVLHDLGYQSHFLLSGDHTRFYRLREQYGERVTTYRDGSSGSGSYINDDRLVESWLARLEVPDPGHAFLFIHLMSVHAGGLRQEGFRGRAGVATALGGRPARGRGFEEYVRRHLDGVLPADSGMWTVVSWLDGVLGDSGRDEYVQRYHDGILQADDAIRRIFEWLDGHGWLEDALVIVTADHGEYLGEFGRQGHNGPPYEPVTNIPLLVHDPRSGPYPARAIYSQVDLAPTFLEAIGAPIPEGWSGVPLQLPTTRCAVAVNSHGARGLVGVVDGVPLKYLEILGEPGGGRLLDLRVSEETQADLLGDPDGQSRVRQLEECAGMPGFRAR